MTQDEFLEILRECIIKKDYTNLVSSTPFEARLDFFNNNMLIIFRDNNICSDIEYDKFFSHLFTEEEALNLLDNYSDINYRYIIILNLSDNEKLKHIQEIVDNLNMSIDISTMDERNIVQIITIEGFLSTIKNQTIKNQILCELYQFSGKLGEENITLILENLNDENKLNVFNDIVKRQINGEFKIIKDYNFVKILKSFPEQHRKEILDILLLVSENSDDLGKSNNNITNISDYKFKIDQSDDVYTELINNCHTMLEVIECFDDKDRMLITKKMYNYAITHQIFVDRVGFIRKNQNENLKDVIKIFMDAYTTRNGVYDYYYDIEKLASDTFDMLFLINMTLELEKELGVKLLSVYTFIRLLEKASIEEKYDIYNTCVLKNERFTINETINNIKDLNFKYNILELLIEKEYFKEQSFEIIDDFIQRGNVDSFPNGETIYYRIDDLYCNRYNLNKENFALFVNKLGYVAIRFLDNQNIINTINLPRNEFIKYINIFDREMTKLSNNDINGICNSFLHREFRLINKQVYNIFSIIEHIINLKKGNYKEELIAIINEISNTTDINKYLVKYEITKDEFINLLLINDSNAISILHDITNDYISKKRDIYVNDRLNNIYDELSVKKVFEKQFYKKTYIKQFTSFDIYYDIRFKILKNRLTKDQLELVNNDNLLIKLIKFKKDPQIFQLTNEEKKHLKTFESLLNILYEEQIRNEKINSENAVYHYYPIDTSNENLLNVIANIDPNVVVKNVLNNQEIYTKLIEILKKYHLLGWNDTFKNLTESADVEFGEDTLVGLISYFNEIYPKLDINSNYLTKMLDYGNLYNFASRRYSYLLGSEDYKLIAANEGKNKASMSKHKRLSRSVELVKKMYERKYTTIPPMEKNFYIPNGKSIGITVGNSTNTINLTYGERTNACLRIGGAFNDLFNFCIENENGFHIRFTNPKTGKFVSRVSGIRNGNTLFLNELRESVDESYDNEDLYEVLKMVSDELIKVSRNSELPIDNVIVTSDYALKQHEKEERKLNLNGDKSALYQLPFNLKVNSDSGIILKTSNVDNSLVPYLFNTDKVPRYVCQRDKIREFINGNATKRVIQLSIINELLGGKKLDDIQISDNIECNYCISGEDWYIAKTIDNKIIQYVMPNSKNMGNATNELNMIMEKLQKNEYAWDQLADRRVK